MNAADSATAPPIAPRSRGRQRSSSVCSRNFRHVTHHVVHHERSQTWSTMRAVYSRRRGARCAPHRHLWETHMGRETTKPNEVCSLIETGLSTSMNSTPPCKSPCLCSRTNGPLVWYSCGLAACHVTWEKPRYSVRTTQRLQDPPTTLPHKASGVIHEGRHPIKRKRER